MAEIKKSKTLPASVFMTDENRHPDPLPFIQGLAPGTGVIFRHYQSPGRAELAKKVSRICKEKGFPLYIAGDVELAKAIGADGVHFPRWAFAGGQAFPDLNPNWVVIASVHDLDALERAEKLGADALLLAPVFPTPSHPKKSALGIAGFTRLANATSLPVYALGGINQENLKKLPPLKNLAGFAGISIFEN